MTGDQSVVSRILLKSKSGEFDLESIHSIKLSGLGIVDIGALGECTGLERLDLSKNQISKLYKLAGLLNLTYLNLSANLLTSLEGLQTLDSLQYLNVAGNLLGSVDCLHCLTGLEKLKFLQIQDKSLGLSNPMCMNRSYLKDVRTMFPKLTSLDGERMAGRGSEVYNMFREIDCAVEASSNYSGSEIQRPKQWVPESFWEKNNNFEKSSLGDADQQLKDLLSSCSKLVETADKKLEELRSNSKDGS
ncbi:hypothetical protein ACJMK2_044546 [Sinanodonta woodiana]|uniref:Leucine-rich repeat-containing protein 61 n=1 Tax=Sinanodonta woodiana TaxID=1069815 RepID=A0ABD3W0F5_SINWO